MTIVGKVISYLQFRYILLIACKRVNCFIEYLHRLLIKHIHFTCNLFVKYDRLMTIATVKQTLSENYDKSKS